MSPTCSPRSSDSSSYAYGTDHAIIEGRYITPTQEVNPVQVFGDGVFTEDWEWDEISQVYDRLTQIIDTNLDTATKAHYRGGAVMREVDIEGLDGQILVPMNCGQDLFDVVAITSSQAGLNASKRRVLSLDRTWKTHEEAKPLYAIYRTGSIIMQSTPSLRPPLLSLRAQRGNLRECRGNSLCWGPGGEVN